MVLRIKSIGRNFLVEESSIVCHFLLSYISFKNNKGDVEEKDLYESANHKTDRQASKSSDNQGRQEHWMRGACAVPCAGLIPKNIFQARMLTPRSKIRSLFSNNREKRV